MKTKEKKAACIQQGNKCKVKPDKLTLLIKVAIGLTEETHRQLNKIKRLLAKQGRVS